MIHFSRRGNRRARTEGQGMENGRCFFPTGEPSGTDGGAGHGKRAMLFPGGRPSGTGGEMMHKNGICKKKRTVLQLRPDCDAIRYELSDNQGRIEERFATNCKRLRDKHLRTRKNGWICKKASSGRGGEAP